MQKPLRPFLLFLSFVSEFLICSFTKSSSMAQTIQFPTQMPSGSDTLDSVYLSNSIINCTLANTFPDNDIPTVDYSMLFSDDPDQSAKSLRYLNKVCEEFGFFYLVNHGVPDSVMEDAFTKSYDYFNLTEEDNKKMYTAKTKMDKIRWEFRSYDGENREYIKVYSHPQYHCPVPSPHGFSEAIYMYSQRARGLVLGLARAISAALGLEERFIEKAFKLESGLDVTAMNLYPPCSRSKGSYGLPEHTDPGFIITLIQDVNGGLEVLNHNGKWFRVNMPKNATLIQLGDHLEVLTNGIYKSHIHRVIVNNNKVKRVSIAILHGPSSDTYVEPAPNFLTPSHPPLYRGMTYKEFLEANDNAIIDVQSSIDQVRLNE